MDGGKKKRSSNFTAEEEAHLASLIKKYWSTIGNKQTDGANVDEKKRKWDAIGAEFNSVGSTYRDPNSLQAKFKNIQKTLKKKISLEKIPFIDTGNGPYNEVKYTYAEELLAPLLGRRITGLNSLFDDDNDQVPENHYLMQLNTTHTIDEENENIDDDLLKRKIAFTVYTS